MSIEVIKTNKCVSCYLYGKLHRDHDLPAVTWCNGDREWYRNGVRHRDNDRPAIERASSKEWYCNGINYVPSEVVI